MDLTMIYSDKPLTITGKLKCSAREGESLYSEVTADIHLNQGWNWLATVTGLGPKARAYITTIPLTQTISMDFEESSPSKAADIFDEFKPVVNKLK